MTAMISDSPWITQGTGLPELLDRTEEPTVAVAYALGSDWAAALGSHGC
jgi:hypothetical protein